MTTPTLPPISHLALLPTPTQTTVLSLLFEPSQALHTLLTPLPQSPPFESYPALISSIRTTLLALATRALTSPPHLHTLEQILGSHPRLGEKGVQGQSKGEQGSLTGDQAELQRLNARYEDAFPGLRYVVFVAGRPLPDILADMRARIARGDIVKEREEAIEAMCAIALDRASKAAISPV
ncbi:hypothetical protein EJ05DRAFT_15062 [Pseudovirgaria hyperparasitica]|uniref:Oxo-4-hydroxy-4-carboxy-5-ureidoimidazoline decarboxylase domain-containing protein n=1 Tax=Pseudovirgaria hyperparasitica TaxID=470096 RepID=A0A6A6WKT7_9PEZI|nr:uncharacterized protein EJ05DRAFT_15062 [Pseudovirgaria hyperparasitica]KAF2762781.1 hypothetical protein EJ05DRAFT_15062 [Pseudovirgaria hyperparasitica]